MRDKQIQISEKLFVEIARYFLLDQEEPDLKESIKKGLGEKLEANIRHQLYTTYKTAATPEQKEKARQEYLDKVGIPRDFRW